MNAYLLVFLSVLTAELGDKTQIATLFFAANSSVSKLGVFVAAAGALAVSTLLAVAVGGALGAWMPAARLRLLAAVGFIGIGLWMLLGRA
jgi:putative Ca2+/H+ antiporter (TMEM165/GDT1 family)